MLAAFSRLISIAIAVLFSAFLAVFGLRWLGSSQQYAPMEHPLLKWPFLTVAESLNAAASGPWLQRLRLRLNAEREWQYLEEDQMRPLKDLKPAAGAVGVWLEVIDPTSADRLPALSEWVEAKKLDTAVVFHSAYQAINREMRKVEPMWLYGTSTAEAAKLRFLNSLFLETVASLDSDILVVDKFDSSRLAAEIRKRHKKIFLLTRDSEAAQASKDSQIVDGVIVAP